MIQDLHSRTIDYVRIAVTDRCNFRCFYCMPEKGVVYKPREQILRHEEITRLLKILAQLGFKKVRFTGGEPFVRKDFIKLLEQVSQIENYESIHITSNGALLGDYISKLKDLGIRKINLSLDSLNRERFFQITRRDKFEEVMQTFYRLLDNGFDVKINTVVMRGLNEQDIIPLSLLAKDNPVTVRYIEEMPFNGGGKSTAQTSNYKNIITILQSHYPEMQKLPALPGDTTSEYSPSGFVGKVGVIPAFSRTFCNTCNRLRITATGKIKTCLYEDGFFNIRDFLRSQVSDSQIKSKFIELIQQKPRDGFEAEKQRANIYSESMSTIGG